MIELWYAILSFMLITYVVLDGRNFGAGIMLWFVARTPSERRQVVAAIGPLVSWHEVWLVSSGGVLFVAFPKLLGSAFSGYYLALFLILWCLILRGISFDVGGHLRDRLWRSFWDFVFVFSNLLLAVLFGAAGGNVARGVPIDAQGNFSMAFFTDFRVHGNVGLLDWYTLSVAVFAVIVLAAHGTTYLAHKTDGPVHARSEAFAKLLWVLILPLFAGISVETWFMRPSLFMSLIENPVSWIGVIATGAGAITLYFGLRNGHEFRAFLGSGLLIAGVLATGAATIFPVMLYSTLDPAFSMTASTASASPRNLMIAIIWWPVALVMSIGYFIYVARYYVGKVSVPTDSQDSH
jgi:cytochrome d ubiquinol oxidase subunit II